MSDVRLLCFDLDETLVYTHRPDERLLSACEAVAAHVPGLDANYLFQIETAVWRDYWPAVEMDWCLGRLDTETVSGEAWRRALHACGVDDEALVVFGRETLARLGREAYRLFDDVLPVLEAVRTHFQLALITNGESSLQREKLNVTGIEQRFGAIVISGEVGIAKPDAAVFEAMLDKAGVAAEQAWHVGDSLRLDVAGARSAGVTSVWLNRKGAAHTGDYAEPHHEIRSLADLPALLGMNKS